MVRKSKSFRFDESTINCIEEIKEVYKMKNGVELSNTKVVELAIYEYWLKDSTDLGEMRFLEEELPGGGKSYTYLGRGKKDAT